jgi:hypothetical protein
MLSDAILSVVLNVLKLNVDMQNAICAYPSKKIEKYVQQGDNEA